MLSKGLKTFTTLIVIAFAFAFIYLPSFSKYQELKRKEIQITRDIEHLGGILRKLLEEERLLKNDAEYLEKMAREHLGRVRPGEVVYKILPMDSGRDPASQQEGSGLVLSA